MGNSFIKRLAKRIVENSNYDEETNSLFITNPGISFELLKSLSKKHNFAVGQTKNGEFISIPTSFKYSTLQNDDISLYSDFMSNYTYYNKNLDTLRSAYQIFNLMEENLSEVSLILDTYVAEVLSQGFVDNPLNIKISNPQAQELIEKVFYKNRIYQRLPNIVRSVAKYGNYFMTLSYPYLEQWMDDKEANPEFKRIDVVEDLMINFVNPMYFKVNTDEFYNPISYETQIDNTFVSTTRTSTYNTKTWQLWQGVHFLIPDETTEPYGKSMLWSMRSSFDQLTTLEGLLGISRASRIQRLVFWVPLPNGVNMVDAFGYINEFKGQYLNSVFNDQQGVKSGRKVPGAMSILTLPKSHDGNKVDVDHIESTIDLSSTEDVEYFLDKILRNSSLPKGYLVGEDVITTAQTLEAQDLKLKRTLIPLKKAVLTGLVNLIENVLTHAGYDVSKVDVEVSLNEPIEIPSDVIAKYADICEMLDGCLKLNQEMPDVNRFQLLVKLGMPVDMARLIISKSAINVLSNPEDLGQFLIGQKTRPTSLNMIGTEEGDTIGEAVGFKVTSKEFLKSNNTLYETLLEVKDALRKSGNKMELKESLFVPTKTIKQDDE